MILSQKLRYLLLVVILLWLIILMKYIGQRPTRIPERPLQMLPNMENDLNAVVEEGVEHHRPRSSSPSEFGKERVRTPSVAAVVPTLDPLVDDELSEVSFNYGKKTQSSTPKQKDSHSENIRQKQVVDAFLHAWTAYKKYAWGFDELKPLSKSGNNWLNVGLTIVDSLDTMIIMNLKEEFKEAKEWVAVHLSTTPSQNQGSTSVQFFEIVIRLLGGLLSAFHLSKEEIFKQKADEFGWKLKSCFGGPNVIPCHRVFLENGPASFDSTNLAEIGTVQLEFRDLARVTGNKDYELKAFRVSEHLHEIRKFDGLLPSVFSGGMNLPESIMSMGGQSDSFYEYLLKQWLQTGKTIDWLRKDYEDAIEGAQKHLMKRSIRSNLLYMGSASQNQNGVSFTPTMEHLACFLPGTLALGYMNGLPMSHLDLAKDLIKTCYAMYSETTLRLSPEAVNFVPIKSDKLVFNVESSSAYNIHRPETVESLFYLYRATDDPLYREWGWEIFRAFENHTRLDEGYAGIRDVSVTKDKVTFMDKMETFYLAETLKYLYLLFSDQDLLPLDNWVFNTEAHPLPVYQE